MTPGGSSGGAGAALAAGVDHARHRLRHRRVDPHPVVAVRSGRLQAAVRPSPGDGAVQLRHVLRGRPDGSKRRRRGAAAERARRAAPARPGILRPKLELPAQFEDVRGKRVALCINSATIVVDTEVEANTRAAAAALADAGAIVTRSSCRGPASELAAPQPGRTSARSSVPSSNEMPATAADAADAVHPVRSHVLRPRRSTLRRPTPPGWSPRHRSMRRSARCCSSNDVLLCPTIASHGFVAGEDYQERAGRRSVTSKCTWPDVMMTLPFNVIGRVPVLAVPSGRTSRACRPVSRSSAAPTTTRLSSGSALRSSRRSGSGPTRPGVPGSDEGVT